jgi:excisionase family DNA binding protein
MPPPLFASSQQEGVRRKEILRGHSIYGTLNTVHMSPKSTREIAREVGVGKMTLERWLREGKIPQPKTISFGGRNFRLWTQSDIKRIKKYESLHLYEGRGRKAKRERGNGRGKKYPADT